MVVKWTNDKDSFILNHLLTDASIKIDTNVIDAMIATWRKYFFLPLCLSLVHFVYLSSAIFTLSYALFLSHSILLSSCNSLDTSFRLTLADLDAEASQPSLSATSPPERPLPSTSPRSARTTKALPRAPVPPLLPPLAARPPRRRLPPARPPPSARRPPSPLTPTARTMTRPLPPRPRLSARRPLPPALTKTTSMRRLLSSASRSSPSPKMMRALPRSLVVLPVLPGIPRVMLSLAAPATLRSTRRPRMKPRLEEWFQRLLGSALFIMH